MIGAGLPLLQQTGKSCWQIAVGKKLLAQHTSKNSWQKNPLATIYWQKSTLANLSWQIHTSIFVTGIFGPTKNPLAKIISKIW